MGINPPFTIRSRAPTRIDLAGGTIDLWPLYLFFDQPRTVNFAIDLFAEATLRCSTARSGDGRVQMRSGDQALDAELGWSDLGAYSPPPALVLHTQLLRFFAERHPTRGRGVDLKLETRAKSPAGAGLGGSSTLSIALIGALASWARGAPVDVESDGERFIEVTRDVETPVIKAPAGLQDYYAAMYGGLQSLRWGIGAHVREKLSENALSAIEKRTLLFYSGQSRNSGINNWVLFKGCIDGDPIVRTRFQAIARAAGGLETAIRSEDWTDATVAIAQEWETRRLLADGITTPAIDHAFSRAAEVVSSASNGMKLAGKVCGAGGGGCFFIFSDALARIPGLRGRVEEEIVRSSPDIRSLPFHAVPHGLSVEVSPGA